MKDLTIIVPYYNREAYLRRSLGFIADCQWRPLHLILVDNGSTDGSRAMCEDFAGRHRSEHFSIMLTEETKRGAPAARNRGLSLCTTEFVYFFDCDDDFDTKFLPAIMPKLRTNIDLLAVTTRQTQRGKTRVRAYRKSNSPKAQILVSHLNTQAMVFRTDFLRSIGGWDEKLPIWNDWELGLRTLLHKPRIEWYTVKPFHTIYVHSDSITGASFSARIADIRRAMETARRQAKAYSAALYLRQEILTGSLQRERNETEAAENKKLTREWRRRESWKIAVLGWLLRQYVSRGGRGAWRIAYALCPTPKDGE